MDNLNSTDYSIVVPFCDTLFTVEGWSTLLERYDRNIARAMASRRPKFAHFAKFWNSHLEVDLIHIKAGDSWGKIMMKIRDSGLPIFMLDGQVVELQAQSLEHSLNEVSDILRTSLPPRQMNWSTIFWCYRKSMVMLAIEFVEYWIRQHMHFHDSVVRTTIITTIMETETTIIDRSMAIAE
jgi:hypothetical protein